MNHRVLLRRVVMTESLLCHYPASLWNVPTNGPLSFVVPHRFLSSALHPHHEDDRDDSRAMKELLDTLQGALVSSQSQLARNEPSWRRYKEAEILENFPKLIREKKSNKRSPTSTSTATSTSATSRLHQSQATRDEHVQEIQLAMNQNRPHAVIHGLRHAIRKANVSLPVEFLHHCFRFFLTRNPLYSHEVLQLQQRQSEQQQQPISFDTYQTLCKGMTVLYQHGSFLKIKTRVARLFQEIHHATHLSRPEKTRLLVSLLESLLQSPAPPPVAGRLLQQLLHQYTLTSKQLQQLVATSRFSTRNVPYGTLLYAWAQSKPITCTPLLVLTTLANMFPFDNTQDVLQALQAIQLLRQTHHSTNNNDDYAVDMGTLHHIMAAAARKGDTQLALSIWDVAMEYSSPTMYEGMIQAFCMSYRQDHFAMACLADMPEEPSRALLRSMSRSIRFSEARIDVAYLHAKSSRAGLHAVMAASAERGDVNRTFAILQDLQLHTHWKPTHDTFSFAMEALAAHAQFVQHVDTTELLQVAETLLNQLEQQDLPMDAHVLDHYVRLLVTAGHVELALQTARDAQTNGYRVLLKTIMFLKRFDETLITTTSTI